jgi:carbonic anhydrase
MKRLYVTPENAATASAPPGAGCHQGAKEIGYRKLMIDTLPNMRMAVKLYRELGFTEAPNYYQTPSKARCSWPSISTTGRKRKSATKTCRTSSTSTGLGAPMQEVDPTYFDKLAHLQTPEFLWIGCSDSRVPANQIVGLLPGEVFVHRNVANLVLHTDLNCLSVIQYAVDVLKVKHIMVVGHYGCGGVGAALHKTRVGIVDFWLHNVQQVHNKHCTLVDSLPEEQRHDRLCELNVLEQVVSLCHTPVVKDAWQRGQQLTVHGWIYGLKDGLVHDLGITVDRPEELPSRYEAALRALECRDC